MLIWSTSGTRLLTVTSMSVGIINHSTAACSWPFRFHVRRLFIYFACHARGCRKILYLRTKIIPSVIVMDGSSLPIGVSIDRNRKKLDRKKRPKSCYELKLYLQEKCPEASVIRKLHPGIRNVFVPRRPASARYCILKCVSAEAREEVKSALHGQHVEPFRGVLKCSDTNVKVMKKLLGVNSKDLKEIRISQADIKHSKMLGQKTTSDVKFNSTQRELFVRYGVEPVSEGVKYESMKS